MKLIKTDDPKAAVAQIIEQLQAGKCADVSFQGLDLVFTPPLSDGAILVTHGADDSPSRTYQRFLRGANHQQFIESKLNMQNGDAAQVIELVLRSIS
jgi:hypothetical protein